MPTTTASPDCSARMPPSFGEPTKDVVGPLQDGSQARDVPHPVHLSDSNPGQQRQPACAWPLVTEPGRSSTENVSDAPGADTQVRPIRPRPATCDSATRTRPSAPPRRSRSGRCGSRHRPRPRATSTGRLSCRARSHRDLEAYAPRAPRPASSSAPGFEAAPITNRWRGGSAGSPCPCSRSSRPRCGRPGTSTRRGCRRRPAGPGRRCPRSARP